MAGINAGSSPPGWAPWVFDLAKIVLQYAILTLGALWVGFRISKRLERVKSDEAIELEKRKKRLEAGFRLAGLISRIGTARLLLSRYLDSNPNSQQVVALIKDLRLNEAIGELNALKDTGTLLISSRFWDTSMAFIIPVRSWLNVITANPINQEERRRLDKELDAAGETMLERLGEEVESHGWDLRG